MSIQGVDQIYRLAFDLGNASLRAAGQAAAGVQKTARDIETTSKVFAPVDTGNLQNSIGVDRSPSGLSAVIGPTANYGGFVERGTSRAAPQAFMGPAADRHGYQLAEALTEIIDGML